MLSQNQPADLLPGSYPSDTEITSLCSGVTCYPAKDNHYRATPISTCLGCATPAAHPSPRTSLHPHLCPVPSFMVACAPVWAAPLFQWRASSSGFLRARRWSYSPTLAPSQKPVPHWPSSEETWKSGSFLFTHKNPCL